VTSPRFRGTTPRRVRSKTALALVLGSGLALSACSGTTLADKYGLSAPERTLVLADPTIPGSLRGTTAIQTFQADVARRSQGRLRVLIRTRVTDTNEERRTVADVASGRVDLGWAEASTLEGMGSASLRPLLLPMVVDSYPLEAAVLSRYSALLVADIPKAVGVTPLALFAGGLRFAAAADHPIVTAADWSGRAFWIHAPGEAEAAIRALGAAPDAEPADRQPLAQSGRVDSAEETWRSYNPYALPFVAANVRLWPRVVVLLGNPAVVGSLTQRERNWLSGAATAAAAWATTHASDADKPGLVAACRVGAKAALATTSELAAMRAAGQTASRRDQPTWVSAMLRDVDSLRGRPGFEPAVSIPDGCAYSAADAIPRAVGDRAPRTGPGPMGDLPAGTYRYDVSPADISASSAGNAGDLYAAENTGRWTWTIGDGRWSLDMRPSASSFPIVRCAGWISISAGIATFTRTVNGLPGGDCVPLVWSARFRVVGSVVQWSETNVPDFSWVFQPKGWIRLR
jgi:TRAP-type C4-dicarboxylate transport system substrate-binding protein